MIVFEFLLLVFLVITAIGACLSKKLLTSVIIFMTYGTLMSIIWLLLEAPDLALTEAAVGTGITSVLFFLAIRKINRIREEEHHEL